MQPTNIHCKWQKLYACRICPPPYYGGPLFECCTHACPYEEEGDATSVGTIDNQLNPNSTNAVTNKVITQEINALQVGIHSLEEDVSALETTTDNHTSRLNNHETRLSALENGGSGGASGGDNGQAPSGQEGTSSPYSGDLLSAISVPKSTGNQVGTVHVSGATLPSASATTEDTRYVITQNITGQQGQTGAIQLASGSKIVPDGGIPEVAVLGGELSWVHSSDIGMIQDDEGLTNEQRRINARKNYKVLEKFVNTRYQLELDGRYLVEPLPHTDSGDPETYEDICRRELGITRDYTSNEGGMDYFRIVLRRQLFLRGGELDCLSGLFMIEAGGGIVCENVTIRKTFDSKDGLIGDGITRSVAGASNSAYAFVKVYPKQAGLCGRLEFIGCQLYGRIVASGSTGDILPEDSTVYARVSLKGLIRSDDELITEWNEGQPYTFRSPDVASSYFYYPMLQCDVARDYNDDTSVAGHPLAKSSAEMEIVQLKKDKDDIHMADSWGSADTAREGRYANSKIMTLAGDLPVYFPDDEGDYVFICGADTSHTTIRRYSNHYGNFQRYKPIYDQTYDDGEGGYIQVQRFRKARLMPSDYASHNGLTTFIVRGCKGINASFDYNDLAVYNKWEFAESDFDSDPMAGCELVTLSMATLNSNLVADEWRTQSCRLVVRDCRFTSAPYVGTKSFIYCTPVKAETSVVEVSGCRIENYCSTFGEDYEAYLSCREVHFHHNEIVNVTALPFIKTQKSAGAVGKLRLGDTRGGWIKAKGICASGEEKDFRAETGRTLHPYLRDYHDNKYTLSRQLLDMLRSTAYMTNLQTAAADNNTTLWDMVKGEILYMTGSDNHGAGVPSYYLLIELMKAWWHLNGRWPVMNTDEIGSELDFYILTDEASGMFGELYTYVNDEVLGLEPCDVDEVTGFVSDEQWDDLEQSVLDRIAFEWVLRKAYDIGILDLQVGENPLDLVSIRNNVLYSEWGCLSASTTPSGCSSSYRRLEVEGNTFDFLRIASVDGDYDYCQEDDLPMRADYALFYTMWPGAEVVMRGNVFRHRGRSRRVLLLQTQTGGGNLGELTIEGNTFENCGWRVLGNQTSNSMTAQNSLTAERLSIVNNKETGKDMMMGVPGVLFAKTPSYTVQYGNHVRVTSPNDFRVETEDLMDAARVRGVLAPHVILCMGNKGTYMYRTDYFALGDHDEAAPSSFSGYGGLQVHLLRSKPVSGNEAWRVSLDVTTGGVRKHYCIEAGFSILNTDNDVFYVRRPDGTRQGVKFEKGNSPTEDSAWPDLIVDEEIYLYCGVRFRLYGKKKSGDVRAWVVLTLFTADPESSLKADPGTLIEVTVKPCDAESITYANSAYTWNYNPIEVFIPKGSLVSATALDNLMDESTVLVGTGGTTLVSQSSLGNADAGWWAISDEGTMNIFDGSSMNSF